MQPGVGQRHRRQRPVASWRSSTTSTCRSAVTWPGGDAIPRHAVAGLGARAAARRSGPASRPRGSASRWRRRRGRAARPRAARRGPPRRRSTPVRTSAPLPVACCRSQRADLPVLLAPGQHRVGAHVPAGLGLALEHARRRGRAPAAMRAYSRPDGPPPITTTFLGSAPCPSVPAPQVRLAADLGVVDALHAAATDHAAPAVVGRDAAADVIVLPVARPSRPFGVGEHLAREQDRVGLVGGEDVLGDARVCDAPDEQHGLVETSLIGLRVAALPALLVRHRRVDVGVVHAGGEVHVVEVDRALEVGDDPLDVLELEIARPERGRVDAVAEERVVADRRADARIDSQGKRSRFS